MATRPCPPPGHLLCCRGPNAPLVWHASEAAKRLDSCIGDPKGGWSRPRETLLQHLLTDAMNALGAAGLLKFLTGFVGPVASAQYAACCAARHQLLVTVVGSRWDLTVSCLCCNHDILAIEMKPYGAPRHWARVDVAGYNAALRYLSSSRRPLERAHSCSSSPASCRHPLYYRLAQGQLWPAVPQVVLGLVAGLDVVVVADHPRTQSANVLYKLPAHMALPRQRVRVRDTTRAWCDGLTALAGHPLTCHQLQLLSAAVTGAACRWPWSAVPARGTPDRQVLSQWWTPDFDGQLR